MPSRNCRTRPLSWRIANCLQLAEAVKQAGWEATWVFSNIIASVDNTGRMEGGKFQLRDMFFPHQAGVTPEEVETALVTLDRVGLIIRYCLNSSWYIQLPKIGKYSSLRGNMRDESDFPDPPADVIETWESQHNDSYCPLVIPAPEEKAQESTEHLAVVDYWNQTGLSKCKLLNESRKSKLILRWKVPMFRESFKDAIDKVKASSFCVGKNTSGWKATFDWFIHNDENWLKALEGKYDDKPTLISKFQTM